MNLFCFVGNLGRDADVKYTATGTALCAFSVAVKYGYGERAGTMWIRCTIWGKRAAGGLPGRLVKGQQVAVSGELSTRTWTGNDGKEHTELELNVNDVTLVGGGPMHEAPPKATPSESFQNADPDFEDDILF